MTATAPTPTPPSPELVPATALAKTPDKDKTPARFGMAPTSLDEAFRLATMVASSELVPADFRGKPANVLIAMELGLEVGIPWMQAIQGTAIINGRPGFFGELFLGVIVASPAFVSHDEYYEVAVGGVMERRAGLVADDWKREDTAAVCTFVRHGRPAPITRRFTVAQAKKAALLNKAGPWQTYPDRMLAMRARSWAGRDAFPDVLKGVQSVDELQDIDAAPAPAAPPREVHRVSESRPAAPVVVPAAAPVDTTITLGPTAVLAVEDAFMGASVVQLADGSRIRTDDALAAADLRKAIASGQRFLFDCRDDRGDRQLVTVRAE